MFSVDIEGIGKVRFVFQHRNPERGVAVDRPFGTSCFVKNDKDEIVARGESLLHVNDWHCYNKERGRKIALGRAIKDMGLCGIGMDMRKRKVKRATIWNTYFESKVPKV